MDHVSQLDLSLNPKAQINVSYFGMESQPFLLIDEVLLHPHDLQAYATQQAQFLPPTQGSFYPGKNADLPNEYGHILCQAMLPFLTRVFGFPVRSNQAYSGFLGLPTLADEALSPLQTIPHFDSVNPHKIAMVHYLCPETYGGTGFYRHKQTGFEYIDARRVNTYRQSVMSELEGQSHPQHVTEDIDNFTLIHKAEVKFNRLIAYRSTSLHAGLLGHTPLAHDPQTGRLTANSFIEPKLI